MYKRSYSLVKNGLNKKTLYLLWNEDQLDSLPPRVNIQEDKRGRFRENGTVLSMSNSTGAGINSSGMSSNREVGEIAHLYGVKFASVVYQGGLLGSKLTALGQLGCRGQRHILGFQLEVAYIFPCAVSLKSKHFMRAGKLLIFVR